MRVPRLAWLVICAVMLPFGLRAQTAQSGASAADVQLQLADLLFTDGRYAEAREAYQHAAKAPDRGLSARAAAGLVLSQLRVGSFQPALDDARTLAAAHPGNALLTAVQGDALWSCGMFDEAEAAYDASLALDAAQPRGRHGHARSLSARNQLDAALGEAREAVRLNPREPEFHSTVGGIYQRMHRYQDAAAAFANYLNLLPNRDRGERALWVRETIRFLESFDKRVPLDFGTEPEDRVWKAPVRLLGDKVFVRGKVNGVSTDFVLDTGAEQTVISRDVARRAGVAAITYTESAGVGDVGFRGLQIGRIDRFEIAGMKIGNIPALIKNPPLGSIPGREPDSFSPLALGLSMRIDYRRRELTMSRQLPEATYATQLPLRMHRLATVRGTVNGSLPASFVVDTGGEVISISGATADLMDPPNPYRRIPLKVYGTSGWDKDAFLMPFVDLAFSGIHFDRIPVVVLNLRAPSALLGYQLGGIVGHKFLSRYTVTVDLNRSILGLDVP